MYLYRQKIIARERILQNQAAQRLDKLLDQLQIEYLDRGNYFIGRCPIHGGDNPSGFNIYRESKKEEFADGGWICNTHHCEKKYGHDLIGFIRAILSQKKHRTISRIQARNYLCKFCNITFNQIKSPNNSILNKQYMNSILLNLNSKTDPKSGLVYFNPKNLIIPANYYIKRGYSSDILIKYNVGYNAYSHKIDVPIYDNDGKIIIGKTSRSEYEKCLKCNCYHNWNEECPEQKSKYPKWKHYGIVKSNILYNFWFAKSIINKTGKVIVVESPGNVWKLVENGIENCVACMGSTLSDLQEILLSSCGVISIYMLPDNDEAGEKFYKKVENSLKKRYNIKRIILDKNYNDIADAPNNYIEQEIKPQL